MKRSKSQAVYKFLPRTWISERDDNGVAVTAQITHWSYKEMKGIYGDLTEVHGGVPIQIARSIQLNSFR